MRRLRKWKGAVVLSIASILVLSSNLGITRPVLAQMSADTQSQSQPSANCSASSPEEEAALFSERLQPYISSVNQEGEEGEADEPLDPLVQAELVAREKLIESHYFAMQIKDKPVVTLSYERYMNIARASDQVLRPYESRVNILFPTCQRAQLQNGSLVGDIELPFDVMLTVMGRAQAENNQQIINYVTNQVTPTALLLGELLDIAARDHNIDTAVVRALLTDDMVSHFFGDAIPGRKLGEAQVLAFLYRGGLIRDRGDHVIVVLPKRSEGINELFNAMTITSDGQFRRYIDLDPALLGRILGQWQVELNYLILSEIRVPSRASCTIDLVGKWQQGSSAEAVPFCPFYALAEQMLRQGSYTETRDFVTQKAVFSQISDMLARQ